MIDNDADNLYGRAVLVAALWCIAGSGLALALVSFKLFGTHGLLGSLIGSAIAFVNLWAVARIVRGMLGSSRTRSRWALLAVVKFTLLISIVYVLVSHAVTPVLPLAIGYASLPIGVVIGQLWTAAPDDDAARDRG
ncbi:MAG TPA: ATP synthase subunit I [Polyangiaceae bacterium]|jgi:hypothetical protein|nr:ATP synthase subunit I [Polyangiaceae bacterium]